MEYENKDQTKLTPEQFAKYSKANFETGFKFVCKNYCSMEPDRHTVQGLKKVGELQSLMRVEDMGSGILIVDIPNIPENDIVKIRSRFEYLLYDPSLFPDYNHPDIEVGKLRGTCLGRRNCYIGLYKHDALRGDRYCLVVKSYYNLSAMMHQRSVAKVFEEIRRDARTQEEFDAMVNGRLSGKKYVENAFYEEVQKKSFDHRMSTAKYIFRRLGIVLPCPASVIASRQMRGGGKGWGLGSLMNGSNSTKTSSVVSPLSCLLAVDMDEIEKSTVKTFGESYWSDNAHYKLVGKGMGGSQFMVGRTEYLNNSDSMGPEEKKHARSDYKISVDAYFAPPDPNGVRLTNWKDYPVVFLSVGSQDTVLIFNHAYTKQDFIDGAPYNFQPWIGFIRYGVESVKRNESAAQIQDLGCPLGIQVDKECQSLECPEVDEDNMRERIKWRSQIDLKYSINPIYYGDDRSVEAEVSKLEDEYNIGRIKALWRTEIVLMTPPVEKDLDLVDFYDFGRRPVMYIPLDKYADLVTIYTQVNREWDARFKQFGISQKTLSFYPPVADFVDSAHDVFSSILMMNKLPILNGALALGHGHARKLWAYYNSGDQHMDCKMRETYGIGDPTDLAGMEREKAKWSGSLVDDGYGNTIMNSTSADSVWCSNGTSGDENNSCLEETRPMQKKECGSEKGGGKMKMVTIGDQKFDSNVMKVCRKSLGLILYVHTFFSNSPADDIAEQFREIRFIDEQKYQQSQIVTDYATDVGAGYSDIYDSDVGVGVVKNKSQLGGLQVMGVRLEGKGKGKMEQLSQDQVVLRKEFVNGQGSQMSHHDDRERGVRSDLGVPPDELKRETSNMRVGTEKKKKRRKRSVGENKASDKDPDDEQTGLEDEDSDSG